MDPGSDPVLSNRNSHAEGKKPFVFIEEIIVTDDLNKESVFVVI